MELSSAYPVIDQERSALPFLPQQAWALRMVLPSLARLAIYAVAPSRVMAAKLGGVGNRCACATGLIVEMIDWSLFAEVVTRRLVMFDDSGNLMRNLIVPQVCLPTTRGDSSRVPHAIGAQDL